MAWLSCSAAVRDVGSRYGLSVSDKETVERMRAATSRSEVKRFVGEGDHTGEPNVKPQLQTGFRIFP